ncbi:prefoldin subunit 6-like [Thamnophis elegans]|uniref:prefoldin subunit 6-like n=1 Tax=Thamnophis elegans TaxID=35005 RepID=UPI001378B8E0|nr:prefoldin subunit 6-like [Thamnophis elegans]
MHNHRTAHRIACSLAKTINITSAAIAALNQEQLCKGLFSSARKDILINETKSLLEPEDEHELENSLSIKVFAITNMSKCMTARRKLEAQLTENHVVKEELDLLDSSNAVYKLIGPVLVKQDTEEAKATVGKRLEYITGEIKRYEAQIQDYERKSEQHREALGRLQQEFQRTHGKVFVKT